MSLSRIRTSLYRLSYLGFTLSYRMALEHFTIGPITQIASNQDNAIELKSLLVEFKLRKDREIVFVRQAV